MSCGVQRQPACWLCRWEKAIKTHTKPYWIRLPSRLPPALLIWFIGGRPLLASAHRFLSEQAPW